MLLEDYSVIAFSQAKSMGIKPDREMINDVISSIWESHERFLDSVNGHGRELTDTEKVQLKRRLNLRAKFAIIDIIRFRTWRPANSKHPNLGTKAQIQDHTLTHSTEDSIINNIDLSRIREYFMIKDYMTSGSMKDVGTRRNVSEGWISQVFSKLKDKLNEV